MLVACKYEEIYAPEIRDFIYMTDKAYSKEQILEMEREIL
jgi:cyclin B